jgi:hypothetical protein
MIKLRNKETAKRRQKDTPKGKKKSNNYSQYVEFTRINEVNHEVSRQYVTDASVIKSGCQSNNEHDEEAKGQSNIDEINIK